MSNQVIPKELRNINTGRIFSYSPALAERADMVPVWENGVNPNFQPEPLTGLQIEDSQSGQLRKALHEKDRALVHLNQQVQAVLAQLNDANETISKLNQELINLRSSPPAQPETAGVAGDPDLGKIGSGLGAAAAPPGDPLSRRGALFSGISKIREANDKNSFTGGGKIRLEALEQITGLQGITAIERDEAVALYDSPSGTTADDPK
jgi:hypothetical protein